MCCRNENILKADVGQQVGVSINDCRIYHDGSIVQELRYPYLELKFTLTEIRRWCVTCDREFDSSVDGDSHKTHITEEFAFSKTKGRYMPLDTFAPSETFSAPCQFQLLQGVRGVHW